MSEALNNLRKELKAKTIDRILTELNLFDRTSKLFVVKTLLKNKMKI